MPDNVELQDLTLHTLGQTTDEFVWSGCALLLDPIRGLADNGLILRLRRKVEHADGAENGSES